MQYNDKKNEQWSIKKLHRKLKIDQCEIHSNLRLDSCALEAQGIK